MAPHSPQKTAERIADLVHATPITAGHTARILRTATDAEGKRLDLWPQPGSGARITSYTPAQMVNLLLALAAGEPIRGPEIVAEFHSLVARRHYHVVAEHKPHPNALAPGPREYFSQTLTIASPSEPLLAGENLGEDLADIVKWLADDDFDP